MSTIIVGDIAEGEKWFGVVAQHKAIMENTFGKINPFMTQWKALSPEVKVFYKLINGNAQAFIYTETGGYEFYVPQAMLDYESYHTSGWGYYRELVNNDQILLFNYSGNDYRSFTTNMWYSEKYFSWTLAAARYRNSHTVISDAKYFETSLSPIVVYTHAKKIAYTTPSGVFCSASAVLGRYCIGLGYEGRLGVWDMQWNKDPANPTDENVFSGTVSGSWPKDEIYDYRQARGVWHFNRAGDRACITVWVFHMARFGADYIPETATPHISTRTSYVLEIGFGLTEGILTDIFLVNQIETPDFCIAADYDWTTEENELVTAQLIGHDYRIARAFEWAANSTVHPATADLWAVGDYVKTTLHATTGDTSRTRPDKLFEITAEVHPETPPGPSIIPPRMGPSKPTHLTGTLVNGNFMLKAITNDDSAMDEWLVVKDAANNVQRSYELVYNRNYQNTVSSAGTVFDSGSPQSFVNEVTGLDLRVKGITMNSGNGANNARAYSNQWTNGTALPSSGTTIIPESNFYSTDKLYARIKIMDIPQTIAAIPYKERADGLLTDLCIYAPWVNQNTGISDPAKAIDVRINQSTDADPKEILNFHTDLHEKLIGEPPLNGRYFVSGVWAKKKDRP